MEGGNGKKMSEKLRAAFTACDKEGNGRLDFNEYLALLKKGNPIFPEVHAHVLFDLADQDRSGEVDMHEFIQFLFENTAMEALFRLELDVSEEEAKQTLLHQPGPLRVAATKAVKARGEKWKDLTWVQRLEEVRHLDKGDNESSHHRSTGAPVVDISSFFLSPIRPPTPAAQHTPKHITLKAKTAEKKVQPARPQAAPPRRGAASVGRFAIAEMGQPEIVMYGLGEDDFGFVGPDPPARGELRNFREHLKTVGSPLENYDIIKFIAKGTAGWVFLAQDKQSGTRVALKFIRMTQARSGIKEWYVSKRLRALEISKVVLTDETVHVVKRSEAPPVIQEELQHAGPVDFYMCAAQELMPWGTLEDLAKAGELSPPIMFHALEDVASTLAAMHANHLQHRDIKPENIMLEMKPTSGEDHDLVTAAKLCDFGSSQCGDDPESCADDVRRFGLTLFSVATGEGWTKNRLLREKHDAMIERLKVAVEGSSDPHILRLPEVLTQILGGRMRMEQIAVVMAELSDGY